MSGSKHKPFRTRVYIDGYNFYYGCLKGTSYKWLDLLRLFENYILPSIHTTDSDGQSRKLELLAPPSIKYFTAKIVESVAKSSDSVSSQARYHTALRKLYKKDIEIIEGYYAVNKMNIRVIDESIPNQKPNECDVRQAWKVEEKQSDVNLSLQAYHDAIHRDIDCAVFVTNDTDIAPALELIRKHTQIQIGVVIPTIDFRQPNTNLVEQAHWCRKHILESELKGSQLPRVIPGRKPTTKPDSWYPHPDYLEQILKLAIPVRGSRAKVFQWMNQTNPYFGGLTPIDLLDSKEGSIQVLDYIHQWIERKESHSDQ